MRTLGIKRFTRYIHLYTLHSFITPNEIHNSRRRSYRRVKASETSDKSEN